MMAVGGGLSYTVENPFPLTAAHSSDFTISFSKLLPVALLALSLFVLNGL